MKLLDGHGQLVVELGIPRPKGSGMSSEGPMRVRAFVSDVRHRPGYGGTPEIVITADPFVLDYTEIGDTDPEGDPRQCALCGHHSRHG